MNEYLKTNLVRCPGKKNFDIFDGIHEVVGW